MIIVASDNGFFYGEHRIRKGKPDPLRGDPPPADAVARPALISAAARPRSGPRARSLGNIDIAPTILDLADAQPCLTRATAG